MVVMVPVDHGAEKLIGAEVDVCCCRMAVANGGFCWLRCDVYQFA